jgi:hypothetical protein
LNEKKRKEVIPFGLPKNAFVNTANSLKMKTFGKGSE